MDERNSKISDFLKEQYQKEFDQKNDYTSRITLMSGILTILGGGLLAMARELEMPSSLNEWVEGATIALSLFFVCISARWVWSAYTNITYLAIPSSADLLAFRDELVEYYQQVDCPEGRSPQSIADAELLAGIDKAYSMLTTKTLELMSAGAGPSSERISISYWPSQLPRWPLYYSSIGMRLPQNRHKRLRS